jgi:hypothetical protein
MVRLEEKIFASVPKLRTTPTNDTVLAVLGFKDLSLLANIVLIVAQAAPWDFADPCPTPVRRTGLAGSRSVSAR